MRIAFVKTILKLAEKDKNLYLLTGDLGFSVFEEFKKKFSDRFINCGIAEQNMIGVAAGLAMSGKKVIVYSIIPFVTMRCFEQVRNDICLQNLDVKIVGVGGGMSYGQQGLTHYAIDDIAIMRSLSNIRIIVPADPIETELAVESMIKINGPVYLRLGKSKEENIYLKPFNFKIGEIYEIRKGKDIVIFSVGPIIKNIIEAVEVLEKKMKVSFKIISVSTIKPINKKSIIAAVKNARAIFTIEEHILRGGLGEIIAIIMAESGLGNKLFKSIGIKDSFLKIVGDQKYLREKNGLSPEKIKKTIEKEWLSKININ
ncbi:hypothetical protein HZB05_02505 [Candidatus Wolfebacteria bacterium]|nr:hypothetical protein [Candidatus Wolfebacteria bacterium]